MICYSDKLKVTEQLSTNQIRINYDGSVSDIFKCDDISKTDNTIGYKVIK